ncbi:MAG: helix-turn-helix domain-containing protein [Bacteroidales bacterium]
MGDDNKNKAKEFQDVGKRLREIRDEEDLTQVEMASKLGISVPMLQNYEAGKNLVSASALVILAGMKVDINWLLAGDVMTKFAVNKADVINPELLTDLIEQFETIVVSKKLVISPKDKALLINRLLPKYNLAEKVDKEELTWLAEFANTNK